MGNLLLIKNGKKYGGQFVATKSFTDRKVISHNNDPVKVFKEAEKLGISDPVVFYVPEKGVIQIY